MPDRNDSRFELDMTALPDAVAASPVGRKPGLQPTSSLAVEEPHLLDYVRVLYKRRWMAITAFLLVFLGVIVYTFTATPIYQASTKLLIETDENNVVNFKQVVNEDEAKPDYYQTQYSILQSRGLARKTLEALQLWDNPNFGGTPDNVQGVTGLFRNAIAYIAGFGRTPTESAKEQADETGAQSNAIDRFLANLTVSPVRNSRLVDVSFRSPDAALSARVANALAKNYMDQNLEYRFMATKDASDWLNQQLESQRTQVKNAETALQQYREQHNDVSFDDRQNIVVQKLADLNAAVTKARTERLEKEAMYRQLASIQNNQAQLDTFPAILNNAFIQQQKAELSTLQLQKAQMAEKLGARHPDMIKIQSAIDQAQGKLQAEIAKVVQAVKNDYDAALRQEQSLASALDQQKSEALGMNRKAIEYSVLVRDVESSRQIYDSLLQRAKETGVAGELKTSNVRVVDPAERPRSPASPQRAVNLALGLFGGLVLGVGLVFFFEYMDNRIKTPDEIKAHLGLPALGLLPLLSDSVTQAGHPLISNGVPPNFSEAFRGIRTNLLFSSAEEGSRSIVVTSSAPGEGKTLVSTNLAIAMAQSGHRVLIVDADMRRPKVHEAFDHPQEPGLSNVLVGNAKASEAVRKTSIPGLWMLGAGVIPPNPAELLGSARFRDFLRSLGAHFDWVIIDSPPVMAVTDAAVIAHLATGILFVVGAEMISRHVASRALDQLEAARGKFVGAVLNRVDLERNAYYYSHYYRREYAQYYAKAT